MTEFSELLGLTLRRISGLEEGSEQATFVTENGRTFKMYHSQDCCESVAINDVVGDIADLLDSPILRAEERSGGDGDGADFALPQDGYGESWTWTFYELATIKGSVTIRWLGESNGYYSEDVSFFED